MFDKIIAYSVKNKFVIGLLVLALILWGSYSIRQIPIDAVPDITNNQVQIITTSPTLATLEIERFVTTPLELTLQNLQNIVEIRSISRFGLSVITIVFEENVDIYRARQLVSEKLNEAEEYIPPSIGRPEMSPISTGLGEIYQYVVRPVEGYEDQYSTSELRTIQDWIVKRQLSGIDGVAEVNSMGGHLKQYEVAVDPNLLKSMNINIGEIFTALEKSNENTGGAYIEKNPNTYYIRTAGLAKSLEDIGNILVNNRGNTPVFVKDIAKVQYGQAPRYGALVRDGKEVVGGKVMMFKGSNTAKVTESIKERVIQIQSSLPEGVIIEPYLVRDKLIHTAIGTVQKNLIEGGLIVIFILVLLLGNWRAGLIVASVIPLSMMFAISMMRVFGISANLMSLGAIDFGLIVDGSVIIVEAIIHRIVSRKGGQRLSIQQMNEEVIKASQKIRKSAAFGEIIILMVYIPILALVGIEGKMFKPMAQTVMLAIIGALILSLTYVPMMVAWLLNKNVQHKKNFSDRIIAYIQNLYSPLLRMAFTYKKLVLAVIIAIFGISIAVFSKMGGEFIPTLEEGDLAMQHILPPGSSLSQSIATAKMIQEKLLNEFPEIEDIVANIGSAEIPTDPMPVEIADYVLIMKDMDEWTSAKNRKEIFEKFEASLHDIPGVGYEFSQPIQLRFNELMTGTKADIAIKLYGDNLDLLYDKAKEAESIIQQLPGVSTVNVEQTIGMPQIMIEYDYSKMARYGVHVKEVNQVIRSSFAGEKAGVIYEGEKRFDLVVRLNQDNRVDIQDVQELYVPLDDGNQVPLSSLAKVSLQDAPMQISRDNTNRRIVIGVNVGDTDVETLVNNIETSLNRELNLPAGYYFSYGGQFENLKAATKRLSIALPIALGIIFILLYFTFGSVAQAGLIFTAIPLSAIGGIWALQLRDMPFSISAGIGFIALFGVAVLNGIVLIGYFNQLKNEGMKDIMDRIKHGTQVRLRPVIMTASVASLGFLPMALSTSGGAEVQRPLATVVIGGLITATFLTLIALPILYYYLARWQEKGSNKILLRNILLPIPILFASQWTQGQSITLGLDSVITLLQQNHPLMDQFNLSVDQYSSLQNMPYSLGNTQIQYEGDGLFKENGQLVNQLTVNQSLPHPQKVKAANAVNAGLFALAKTRREINIQELVLSVKLIYYEAQYQNELWDVYEDLIKVYREYLKKSEVRRSAGLTQPLEAIHIQSQLEEYQIQQRGTRLEIDYLEEQLAIWTNQNLPVHPLPAVDTITWSPSAQPSSLWTTEKTQSIDIQLHKLHQLKTSMKPDFNIGYGLQNYFDGGQLHGLQLGMTLPLMRSQQKRLIESQNIEIKKSELDVEIQSLEIANKIAKTIKEIEQYHAGFSYYKTQIETINPMVKSMSEAIYDAGEMDYLDLLKTLDLLFQKRKGYLNQRLGWQNAIAQYQYFTQYQ
ncbi:CusA/CzcA family heavy metal efflux RND transporter [Membranihabitans marinus]|uniref:CusA/CzcA family heavy metal efflux RND transporter n=1 Tax=Membranihabitans marinus TaxID=1227546 RepID=UPI001F0081B3|nr:CusA/CzcA family heavy metal efflux RND transporter [Membranihabitans marinus]